MRRVVAILAFLPLAFVGPTPAGAQIQFGPQASIGSDSGLGLGGRLLFPLRVGALGVDGAIDANYFLGGGTAVDSWIDANANVRVPIPLAQDFTFRVGAGVNSTFISLDTPDAVTTRTDTELGFNVLAAIELVRGHLAPFLELRVVVGGAEQLVLTGGFTEGQDR
jgi:hypothetical protein